MIDPYRLAEDLDVTAKELRNDGPCTWQRVHDWTTAGRMPAPATRGGGLGAATPEDDLSDRRDDRAAAAYQLELDTLTRRIDSDVHRLRRIIAITNPDRPKELRHSEMTSAQLIADGWCPSCFRDNRYLEPLAAGRYSDRCRPCGEYRARENQDPPQDALRIIHTKGKALRKRVLHAVKGA